MNEKRKLNKKELGSLIITSIVKRTKYENVSADIPGVGVVSRDVVVFHNKTDEELDIYVRMGGKYSDFYYKIAHFGKYNMAAFDEYRLPELVEEMVLIEGYADFETNVKTLGLLCEKHLID